MHRIKADKPQLHWAIYGLANYLGEDANLGERDLWFMTILAMNAYKDIPRAIL